MTEIESGRRSKQLHLLIQSRCFGQDFVLYRMVSLLIRV